jgi:hypothetical protein
MMGIAQDAFGWTAAQYWNATPHEFWSMVEARREANKR